jgi:hypothetical protein
MGFKLFDCLVVEKNSIFCLLLWNCLLNLKFFSFNPLKALKGSDQWETRGVGKVANDRYWSRTMVIDVLSSFYLEFLNIKNTYGRPPMTLTWHSESLRTTNTYILASFYLQSTYNYVPTEEFQPVKRKMKTINACKESSYSIFFVHFVRQSPWQFIYSFALFGFSIFSTRDRMLQNANLCR